MASIFSRDRKALPVDGFIARQPVTIDPFGRSPSYSGGGFIMTDSGTADLLNSGYKSNGAVYGIISKIARKVATVPLVWYVEKKAGARKKLRDMDGFSVKSAIDEKRLLKAEFVEVETEDALTQLVANPNPGMGYADFTELHAIFKLLYGGAFTWANRGAVGTKILGLYLQPSAWVQMEPNRMLVKPERVFIFNGATNTAIDVNDFYRDVFPDPDINITGSHLFGQSPLEAVLRDIKGDNEAREFQLFNFKKRGANGVFLPDGLDAMNALRMAGAKDEFRKELAAYLHDRNFSETDKPYLNMLLKYVAFQTNSADLQVIETSDAMVKRIAGAYDFPLPLLFTDAATRDNIKASIKYLSTNTIQPLLKGLEAFWTWVAVQNGYPERVARFDISLLPELQEDFAEMAKYLSGLDGITANEIRAALNYGTDELPEMDIPLIGGARRFITDLADDEI